MDASAVVPNTAPACVPEKCSVAVKYVPIVTYQQPQTTKLRNIIMQSRMLTEPGMFSRGFESDRTVYLVSTSLDRKASRRCASNRPGIPELHSPELLLPSIVRRSYLRCGCRQTRHLRLICAWSHRACL